MCRAARPRPKPSPLHGFMKLFDKIQHQSITQVPWYRKTEPYMPLVPVLGPADFRPEDAETIAAILAGQAGAGPLPVAALTAIAPDVKAGPAVGPWLWLRPRARRWRAPSAPKSWRLVRRSWRSARRAGGGWANGAGR